MCPWEWWAVGSGEVYGGGKAWNCPSHDDMSHLAFPQCLPSSGASWSWLGEAKCLSMSQRSIWPPGRGTWVASSDRNGLQ